jgi:hypothetical protein
MIHHPHRPVRTTAIAALAHEAIQQMAASDWTDPKLHPAQLRRLNQVRMEAWRTSGGSFLEAAKAASEPSTVNLTPGGLLMEDC